MSNDAEMETVTTKVLLYRVAEILRSRGFNNAALVAQALFAELRPLTESECRKLTPAERIETHAAVLFVEVGLHSNCNELPTVDVPLVARVLAHTANTLDFLAVEQLIPAMPQATGTSATVH